MTKYDDLILRVFGEEDEFGIIREVFFSGIVENDPELQEIDFSKACISSENYNEFLKRFRHNTNIKKIVISEFSGIKINNYLPEFDLSELLRVIEKRGVCVDLAFRDCSVEPKDLKAFFESDFVSSFSIYDVGIGDEGQFGEDIKFGANLKSISIDRIHDAKINEFLALIAKEIKNSEILEELTMAQEDIPVDIFLPLIEAVKINKSIKKLTILEAALEEIEIGGGKIEAGKSSLIFWSQAVAANQHIKELFIEADSCFEASKEEEAEILRNFARNKDLRVQVDDETAFSDQFLSKCFFPLTQENLKKHDARQGVISKIELEQKAKKEEKDENERLLKRFFDEIERVTYGSEGAEPEAKRPRVEASKEDRDVSSKSDEDAPPKSIAPSNASVAHGSEELDKGK